MAKDKEYKQETAAEIAKAKRLAAHEEKEAVKKVDNDKEEFRKFFAQKKAKIGLSADLEEVLWIHFKSYGFNKKESFSSGLKHFGIGE
jgi:uncharacterized membrane protein